MSDADTKDEQLATLGAGCFWCVEAVYAQLKGVHSSKSGFMGGDDARVSYEEVCSGTSGHAEVVQLSFDPSLISYQEILSWFWRLHDPTTLDRQGNDVGTQYRSAIYFHGAEQERTARESMAQAQASGVFADPIVTEISPASQFHPATESHQKYYERNSRQPYCQMVIRPKLEKLGLDS